MPGGVRTRQQVRAKGELLEYQFLASVPAEEETIVSDNVSLSVVNPNNFPVSHSDFVRPLFGKFSNSTIEFTPVSDRVYALRRIYITEATQVVTIHVRIKQTDATTNYYGVALYADNAGSPGVRLGTATSYTGTAGTIWYRLAFASPISVTATYYWVAFYISFSTSVPSLFYDTETNASGYDATSFANPFGSITWMNDGFSAGAETNGTLGQLYTLGDAKMGQSFTAIAGTCRGVMVHVKRVGMPSGSLAAELRSVSFTGAVLASGAIPYSSVNTDFTNVLIPFTSAATLTVSTTYYICIYVSGALGNVDNCYVLALGANLVAGTAAWYFTNALGWQTLASNDICFGVPTFVLEKHITQENITGVVYANIYAANWAMQSILPLRFCPFRRLTLYLKKLGAPAGPLYASLYAIDSTTGKATGQPFATGSIAAASVSTTVGWLNIDFSWPMELNTQYAVVLSSPASVDAANCYMAGYVTSNPYAAGQYGVSTDSGVTWTLTAANDFCFDVWVPTEQLVFTGTFNVVGPPDLTWSVAKVYLGFWATMKSLDGQYMTLRVLVNGVEQTDAGQAFNGVAETEYPVVPNTLAVPQTSWTLAIYGAGDGYLTGYRYARHHYEDSQTITPSDFDCAEFVLYIAEIKQGSLVILNDSFKQRLYCQPGAETSKIYDMTGAAREINIRKVYFAKGEAYFSFIGRGA